jgi:hypothetical protein
LRLHARIGREGCLRDGVRYRGVVAEIRRVRIAGVYQLARCAAALRSNGAIHDQAGYGARKHLSATAYLRIQGVPCIQDWQKNDAAVGERVPTAVGEG